MVRLLVVLARSIPGDIRYCYLSLAQITLRHRYENSHDRTVRNIIEFLSRFCTDFLDDFTPHFRPKYQQITKSYPDKYPKVQRPRKPDSIPA